MQKGKKEKKGDLTVRKCWSGGKKKINCKKEKKKKKRRLNCTEVLVRGKEEDKL